MDWDLIGDDCNIFEGDTSVFTHRNLENAQSIPVMIADDSAETRTHFSMAHCHSISGLFQNVIFLDVFPQTLECSPAMIMKMFFGKAYIAGC